MPSQPGHPSHQQLAAYQAGELGRRERVGLEAHLGTCADCAALLAGAERAGRLLAALPREPELPPGLHERVAAAVERELATQRALAAPSRSRAPAWYRRRGALGALGAATAAALLLVALVPRLHFGGPVKATSSAVQAAQQAGGGEAAAPGLTLLSAPAGFSAGDLKARLASDPRVRVALSAAAQGLAPSMAEGQGGGRTAPSQGSPSGAAAPAPHASIAGEADLGAAKSVDSRTLAACEAAAARLAPGSRPALLVATAYQGRPAIVLVTVAPRGGGGATRATLWYFADSTCGQQPIHSEQATLTLP